MEVDSACVEEYKQALRGDKGRDQFQKCDSERDRLMTKDL